LIYKNARNEKNLLINDNPYFIKTHFGKISG